MQLSFKKDGKPARHGEASLAELRPGQMGVLDRLEVPDETSQRLMELGFLPGVSVTAAHSAPGGDPRVFRVDGSEVALRNETARRMILRPSGELDFPSW